MDVCMGLKTTVAAACAAALFMGCKPAGAGEAVEASPAAVDSVVPREVALRRFREGLRPVERLEGGADSREAALAAYVRALETRDTVAIARLSVSRDEFAWLVYPTATQGLPPYDVEPGLMWFLLSSRSDRGARRALAVYGGRPLRVTGFDCAAAGSREGANTLWGPCTARWRTAQGESVSVRLVSQILEREGRFKVLSYGNNL